MASFSAEVIISIRLGLPDEDEGNIAQTLRPGLPQEGGRLVRYRSEASMMALAGQGFDASDDETAATLASSLVTGADLLVHTSWSKDGRKDSPQRIRQFFTPEAFKAFVSVEYTDAAEEAIAIREQFPSSLWMGFSVSEAADGPRPSRARLRKQRAP